MRRRTGDRGVPISRRRREVTTSNGAGDELEAPLQAWVRRECKARDLLHYHTHRSQRSEPGFPDSVIVGSRGILFRELKSDVGRPSAEQVRWLHRLGQAGADAGIWTPQDRRTGRILNELNWLARRRPAAITALGRDLAKTLYLLSCEAEPAAALHWDARSRHVDQQRWHLHSDAVLRMVRDALPHTAEQVDTWLRSHGLASPAPTRIFQALAEDLTRASARRP